MQGRLDLYSSIGDHVERFDDVEISQLQGATRGKPREIDDDACDFQTV